MKDILVFFHVEQNHFVIDRPLSDRPRDIVDDLVEIDPREEMDPLDEMEPLDETDPLDEMDPLIEPGNVGSGNCSRLSSSLRTVKLLS